MLFRNVALLLIRLPELQSGPVDYKFCYLLMCNYCTYEDFCKRTNEAVAVAINDGVWLDKVF